MTFSWIFPSFSFEATNAEAMKRHVKGSMSRFVNTMIAQVLDEKIPPFILQIYGTNSEFTACDTVQRWNYTKTELLK